jgi:hypothetical protein
MGNIGLLISTWEFDLIKKKKFWRTLNKLIENKKINAIGFPPLSPYGLTYPSKSCKQYVYIEEFMEIFVNELKSIIRMHPEVDVYLWCSILYNTFLPEQYHQQDLKGHVNTDFICPNKIEVYRKIKRILDDILEQKSLDFLLELGAKPYILLDATHFFDIDYCGCQECTTKFKEREKVEDSSFQRFKKEFAVEPLVFQKWINFRGNSLVEFFNTIIRNIRHPQDRISISYSGFADETSVLSGDIKRGSLFHDFLRIDASQIIIKGADRWLFNREISEDLRFTIPLWRDMVLNKGKDFGLKFHGHLLPNRISTVEKLAKQNGISRVFFCPLSKIGIENIFRYLSD